MKISDCPLSGLKTIQLQVFGDNRGFFAELFNALNFAAAGLPTIFAQDNHSRSVPGSIRGLHFQRTPAQGKLVGVMRGRIMDVALDIRPDSPTFGEHYSLELTGENGLMLWIPSGFAHGFCVLGNEPADILYKVDSFYNKNSEDGIRFDDPELGIAWNSTEPIVSERDRQLQNWKQYCANPLVME